jgi:hypothetical protein
MHLLKLSPRRRGARLVALLAGALVVVGALGATGAAAANYSNKISCVPSTVQSGQAAHCLATIGSSGPAPTGQLHFATLGFMELGGNGECTLVKVSEHQSFCSISVRGTVAEQAVLDSEYFDSTGLRHDDQLRFNTLPGKVEVHCNPTDPVAGDPFECEAFVPDTAGAPHPGGKVRFSAIVSPVLGGTASIAPECTLRPLAKGSGCTVTGTTRRELGNVYGVFAEYEGDDAHPADYGSWILEVKASHYTATTIECETLTPVAKVFQSCDVTVRNTEATGGAPVGEVGGLGGYCTVQPVGPQESRCTMARVAVSEAGKPNTFTETFEGRGGEAWEYSVGELTLYPIAGHRTSTAFSCPTVPAGQTTACTATVTDLDAAGGAPTGKVFIGNYWDVPEISCRLSPAAAANTAACTIPLVAPHGSVVKVANYSGSLVQAPSLVQAYLTGT